LESENKDANEVIGFARWAAGRWTLEIVRRLKTYSSYDVELKTGVMMWVAPFDHSEKRHGPPPETFRAKARVGACCAFALGEYKPIPVSWPKTAVQFYTTNFSVSF
jgi:hypothetical protein